jgi:hypothetical protein
MYPPTTMTDEEFREFAEELEQSFRAILRGERKSISVAITVIGIGLLFGLAIGGLAAGGQTAALGFHPAWATYGAWWLLSPLIGAVVPMVIYIGSLIIFSGSVRVGRLFNATFSDRARDLLKIIAPILLVCATLGAAIMMPAFIAYQEARRANPILAESNLRSLGAVDKAIAKQSEALQAFSTSGRDLLLRLDGVRSELSQTLMTAETQLRTSENTSSQISELLTKQKQIELRMAELQRILDGAAPITKQDLESSSLEGLLVGALIGFIASLAASFVYGWLARVIRRRVKAVSNTEG